MKGKEQLSFEIGEEKSKSDNKEEKYWKLEFYEEKNFKDTEIGPIPEDWEVVRLGEVVYIYDKERIPLSEEERKNRKGIYPYCGANGIIDYIDSYIFEGEYILLAEDGGFFRKFENSAYIMNGKFWVNNHAHILKAKEIYSFNYFILYYLIFEDISKYVSGTTRQKLTQTVMREIKIPLPPLSEQKAIAEVLSTIQSAREKTEEVIKATKELKKSIMKHLFTYGPVPIDRIDKIKLKETEIGPIPEHWEVVRLGEVAEILMGQSPPGESYNDKGDGIPFLQGKAEFGDIFPSYIKYTSAPIKIAKEGSVLISVRAPVGDVNISNKNYCIGRGLAALNMKNLGSNLFLFYYLIFSKKRIEELGTGTTFKSVSKSQLETLPIPLPPLAEQQKISEILQSIDEKIQKEEEKKKALDNLFKSMLSNLMSGKIRIKILEED